jgi:hypothetical protein
MKVRGERNLSLARVGDDFIPGVADATQDGQGHRVMGVKCCARAVVEGVICYNESGASPSKAEQMSAVCGKG